MEQSKAQLTTKNFRSTHPASSKDTLASAQEDGSRDEMEKIFQASGHEATG